MCHNNHSAFTMYPVQCTSISYIHHIRNEFIHSSIKMTRKILNFFLCVCVITRIVNIIGPVTVPMVSQSGSPPIPMPVQVPPGHVMQQIVDENGTLRHVILSTAQHQQIHGQGSVQGVQPHIHGHYVSIYNKLI